MSAIYRKIHQDHRVRTTNRTTTYKRERQCRIRKSGSRNAQASAQSSEKKKAERKPSFHLVY